jgi:acetamidase/formamidase
MRRLTREQTSMFFDPSSAPVIEVGPGERLIVETRDSLCGLAKRESPVGLDIDDVIDRLGGACPVTGPIAVHGAEPGMVVSVLFHRIQAIPAEGEAWTGIIRGFGALSHDRYGIQEPLKPVTRLVPYSDGVADFSLANGSNLAIPIQPFLGTVGVAPRWERRMSFSQSTEYLGDVDLPQLTTGATLVLPVNVPGALLSLGDAHAAQGAGEITGAVIEIEAEAEISCQALAPDDAGWIALPQLNTVTSIGSIAAMEGNDLTHCARAAYRDLLQRLVRFYGFTTGEAYQVLGLVGQLRVGNMIDPFYSVLASIDRRFLPEGPAQ